MKLFLFADYMIKYVGTSDDFTHRHTTHTQTDTHEQGSRQSSTKKQQSECGRIQSQHTKIMHFYITTIKKLKNYI